MNYTMKNSEITLDIKLKGAEINSIKYNDTEYLWQGDSAFWGKKAPILFPAVGRLKESKTKINGKTYTIGQHGFIQNAEFKVKSSGEDFLELYTTYNEETLKAFPFKYEFLVKFSIKDNKITQETTVRNLDDNTMCYAFGLHPGFNCGADGDFEKYSLKFNKKTTLNTNCLTEDLMVSLNDKKTILSNSDTLDLKHSLFDIDAIIIEKPDFSTVSLYKNNDIKIFDFEFEGFDMIAFWQAKNAPFLCFEPWDSLCGVSPHPENLEENPTIKFLQAKQEKTYKITITL